MVRIAYFVNQYPAVSHTFIRREIRAMEALGVSVVRISARSGPSLVDEQDLAEAAQTRFLLKASFREFGRSFARALFARPSRIAATFWQAIRMGRRSDGGLIRHMAYLAEAVLLADWCAGDGIEHIHAHFGTNSTAVAMFASRLSGIPYSFTAHGPEEFEKGPLLSLDEKLRHAAFAVCVSSFGRVQLMRLTKPDLWDKISIVHCGLDNAFLTAVPTDCSPVRRLVCVGRLCAEKAQVLLVAAAAKLRDAGEECQIVLAGDGPARVEIENAIARANLQSSITITGWVSGDRIKAEIEAACALVLPSFAENMPVVIMEAMALGRPVISTFIAGIPELVEPRKSGWLVPAGDDTALAQAMHDALVTPVAELTKMGNAGRRHVLDQHDALKEARKLKDLIERVSRQASRSEAPDGNSLTLATMQRRF